MILKIRRGRAKNRDRTVSGPVFTVGANVSCDMVLGDAQFAPIHFYVLNHEGKTTLRKVASSPAVSINGEWKESSTLKDGDRIRTGPYEFIVKAA